jgi:GxxExxY protein
VFSEHAEKQAAGDLTGRVIGLAIKVHKTVGPGFLEQIYEDCLCHEMVLSGLRFQRQVELSLIYDGVRLPRAYRTDIVAGETVILEIESIEHILPVHEAQLLTYLRPSHCTMGLLPRTTGETLRRKCSLKPLDDHPECQNGNCCDRTVSDPVCNRNH